jgi:hypothetical protein
MPGSPLSSEVLKDELTHKQSQRDTVDTTAQLENEVEATIELSASFLAYVAESITEDQSTHARTALLLRLESASLPVVTAFHIQEAYNALLVILQDIETKLLRASLVQEEQEEGEDSEELDAKREIILGELLRIALKLDYSDEIGRRKVFSVVSL